MTLSSRSKVLILSLLTALVGMAGPHLSAAERPTINITGYVIDAELDPADHTLKATTRVTFTATDSISAAVFELHNALKVDSVADAQGHALSGERGPNATISVALPSPMSKGASATLVFVYGGTLSGSEESPVEGLKVASIGDPISYLLYAGRWFPMVGYLTDRFTAEIHVKIPTGYRVVGSGSTGSPREVSGGQQFNFNWGKASFPGTIIAGKFNEPVAAAGAPNVRVYLTDAHKNGTEYAQTAAKEFEFFGETFGDPATRLLNVVELPDDTLPAYWAPEIVLIAGARIADRNNYRLLANTMAHQWWGCMVSPATLNDAWITNGMSRYGELMYVERVSGQTALQAAVIDISAGALAYDTVPLSSASKLDPFSTEFQSLVTDKGAMILHMLRWVLGEDKYNKTMREFAATYAGKSASMDDFRAIAEKNYGEQLTWFFSQWLDSTGAPEFKVKYSVYRLGGAQVTAQATKDSKVPGFRVTGEISQDLDLFRMPVDLRIDTDGKTEDRKLEVVGTSSPFSIETFGRPRRIAVDPDHHVLTNSSDVKLRSSILRGMALQQQGDLSAALAEFNKALDLNKNSSLAHYRIAEIFFLQRNYQSSANSYRSSINGNGEPRWTEVWSHIQLGKIFDTTGQRERAINEYRQAIQTNDDTFGALEEARKYLQKAYERPKNKEKD